MSFEKITCCGNDWNHLNSIKYAFPFLSCIPMCTCSLCSKSGDGVTLELLEFSCGKSRGKGASLLDSHPWGTPLITVMGNPSDNSHGSSSDPEDFPGSSARAVPCSCCSVCAACGQQQRLLCVTGTSPMTWVCLIPFVWGKDR